LKLSCKDTFLDYKSINLILKLSNSKFDDNIQFNYSCILIIYNTQNICNILDWNNLVRLMKFLMLNKQLGIFLHFLIVSLQSLFSFVTPI